VKSLNQGGHSSRLHKNFETSPVSGCDFKPAAICFRHGSERILHRRHDEFHGESRAGLRFWHVARSGMVGGLVTVQGGDGKPNS